MFRRLMAPLFLMCSLTACTQPASPPDAAAPTPAASAPTTPDATTGAEATAPAAASVPAAETTAAAEPASAPTAAIPPGEAPREGTDYEVLPIPQPTYGQGKIEVAEVFSYQCVHCAEFQPQVNAWKRTQPADVRWEYVPAVFGGTWDTFARAYLTAEIMGVVDKTHDAVFKGVFVDQVVKKATPEELADLYASLGVDRARFLSTMQSFGVTAKLNRAKQFALRTGITATPTIIVNGKYRVNVTPDRGFPGMLSTVNHLIARERVAAAPTADAASAP